MWSLEVLPRARTPPYVPTGIISASRLSSNHLRAAALHTLSLNRLVFNIVFYSSLVLRGIAPLSSISLHVYITRRIRVCSQAMFEC